MYLKKFVSACNLLSFILPLCALTINARTYAQEAIKPSPIEDVAGGIGQDGFKAPDYAILPTGKTLPKGIFRAQYISAFTFSDFGYDENGKQGKNGLDYGRYMSGIQLEYGLSNSVSLAIGIPYVFSNHVAMDGSVFQSTNFYKKYYNKFVDELSSAIQATFSNSKSAAAAYINSGGVANTNITIVLPTGEQTTIPAGQSIKKTIQNLVVSAAEPSNGANGIGDIQVGFLWNAISEESPIRHVPLYFSIGGGLRLPTGEFDIPSALRSTGGDGTLITGGGTYDALLRWNLDYVAIPGFILSWQHQMELSLTSATLGRSKMLNPTQKNTADASAPQTVGSTTQHGDYVGNTLTFYRKGIHQIGFVQAAWGVGNVKEELKWLGFYTQMKYNVAAQAYLNDMPVYAMGDQFYLKDPSLHNDTGYEQYFAYLFGTKLSGLPYMIPGEVSIEFEYPYAGRNRLVSPMNVQMNLGIYF